MLMSLRKLGLGLQPDKPLSADSDIAVSTLNLQVWITDQNAIVHMTNTRYFELMNMAEAKLLRRNGLAKRLSTINAKLFGVHSSLDVYSMLKFPTRYQIRSRLLGANNSFLAMEHVFHNRKRAVARGWVLKSVSDPMIGKASAPIPVTRAQLGFERLPLLPDELSIWANRTDLNLTSSMASTADTQ